MDLSTIPDRGTSAKYTKDQIAEAALQYAIYGLVPKVSEVTGLPESIIRYWKVQEWWGDLMHSIREGDRDFLDAASTRILKKVVKQLEDRVDYGDVVPMRMGKKGVDERIEMVNKPVSAKDLSFVGAVWFDKQRVMRNQPTNITSSSNDALLGLAEKIRQIEEKEKIVSEQ